MRVEGWPAGKDRYGATFVHNVFPDHVGKGGGRVRVRGRVVSRGYGTLSLWYGSRSREATTPLRR